MNPIAQEFTKAFREKFKKEPNANAALGYDCYMLLIDCIKRAGKADPEAITEQLAAAQGLGWSNWSHGHR